MSDHSRKTPRDLLRVIFRRRNIFMLASTLFAVVVLIGAHQLPLKYTGTASFTRTEDASTSAGMDTFSNYRQTLIYDLKGREAVTEVIKGIRKLMEGLPTDEQGNLTDVGQAKLQTLVKEITKNILVEWKVRTDKVDLIQVSYSDKDGMLAKEIPNSLVSDYMKRTIDSMISRLTKTKELLEVRAAEANKALTAAKKERTNFVSEQGNIVTESTASIDRLLSQADDEAQRIQIDLATMTDKINLFKTQLEIVNPKAAQQLPRASAGVTADGVTAIADKLTQLVPGPTYPGVTTQSPAGVASPEAAASGSGPDTMIPNLKKKQAPEEPRQSFAPLRQPSGATAEKPAEAVTSGSGADNTIPNVKRRQLQDELKQLEDALAYEKVAAGRKETHPRIISLKNQIAAKKMLIESEPENIEIKSDNKLAQELALEKVRRESARKFEADRIQAEINALQGMVALNEKRLADLEKDKNKYRLALMKWVDNQQLYQNLSEKVLKHENEKATCDRELNKVADALTAEASQRKTRLEAAEYSEEIRTPSSPSLMMILAFAIAGGLAFGSGLVLIGQVMDRSITTPEDAARHFDLPVQGVIGEIISPNQRLRSNLLKWVLAPTLSVFLVVVLGFSGMSIYLKLQDPKTYETWRASPRAFVMDYVTKTASGLRQRW